MAQRVTCRFQEYKLPEKPSWLDRLLMPVSETWGLPGYRQDKSFTLTLEHPELFLVPKARFSVSGALAQRPEPVEFEIVKWTFRLEAEDRPEIDLAAREIKLSPLQRWFANSPDGKQYAIAVVAVLLPLMVAGFCALAIWNYPDPRGLWAWFGQHVRGIVGWSLFVLVLIGGLWAYAKTRKSAFTQNVLLFLWGVSIWVVPLIWLQVSLPPRPFSGNPDEYIQYLDFLRARFGTFALLLAGIVPWLTLLLKWLGWDLLASVVGLVFKKKDSKT
jgi:hypothetical protein